MNYKFLLDFIPLISIWILIGILYKRIINHIFKHQKENEDRYFTAQKSIRDWHRAHNDIIQSFTKKQLDLEKRICSLEGKKRKKIKTKKTIKNNEERKKDLQ